MLFGGNPLLHLTYDCSLRFSKRLLGPCGERPSVGCLRMCLRLKQQPRLGDLLLCDKTVVGQYNSPRTISLQIARLAEYCRWGGGVGSWFRPHWSLSVLFEHFLLHAWTPKEFSWGSLYLSRLTRTFTVLCCPTLSGFVRTLWASI